MNNEKAEPEAQGFYDRVGKRVVYLAEPPTEEFWDALWDRTKTDSLYRNQPSPRNFVVRTTTQFLKPGATVLEGGCGLAHHSWDLFRLGYKTIASDFAPRTIQFLEQNRPEVGPMLSDVRGIDLPAESIDGYWSLGVIEHFYDGYGAILDDMKRLIRPGGFLFLTFPYMNPLRKGLAELGQYPAWSDDPALREKFYQFALDADRVQADLEKRGFVLRKKEPFLSLRGLEYDVQPTANYIKRVRRGSRFTRRAGAVAERAMRGLCSHLVLLVMQKEA